MSTLSAHILVSNTIVQQKEQMFLREKTDLRAGIGRCKMSLEHFIMQGSKKKKKKAKGGKGKIEKKGKEKHKHDSGIYVKRTQELIKSSQWPKPKQFKQ